MSRARMERRRDGRLFRRVARLRATAIPCCGVKVRCDKPVSFPLMFRIVQMATAMRMHEKWCANSSQNSSQESTEAAKDAGSVT